MHDLQKRYSTTSQCSIAIAYLRVIFWFPRRIIFLSHGQGRLILLITSPPAIRFPVPVAWRWFRSFFFHVRRYRLCEDKQYYYAGPEGKTSAGQSKSPTLLLITISTGGWHNAYIIWKRVEDERDISRFAESDRMWNVKFF